MIDIETYKYFLGIETFPQYSLEYFEQNLAQNYVSVAQAIYDPQSGEHMLRLLSGYEIPLFILYHELTHIYDMEVHKSGETNHDYCLTGYMEYHASQIELMVLMGAVKCDEIISFSMSDSISLMNCTVQQYLEQKLITVCDLICDKERNNREKAVGVFFNFLGLKSICSMYATDFCDSFDYFEVSERLPSLLLIKIWKEMQGWIKDVENSVVLYSNVRNYIV